MKKVILIGWDGADWRIIHPLLDAGKMPNLERMIREGVMGNLSTLYPSLSPMLWTSIATGKRPFKHGILGFIEPDPSGTGIRPITNISRKCRALWNIMTLNGLKSVVVGWWPSHPAEPINGVMVSNHYQRAVAPFGKPWPMKPGTVYPERLNRNLAQLRIHPQELDVGLILNFLPRLSEIDQDKDHRVENIAKIIADCMNINRAATAIMDHEPWDFAAIYYDGIDHFCHGFINYYPPRLPWVKKEDFELYKNVVESGYIYHDILLGTLLERVDNDSVVILVSDHGFHSNHLRPRSVPIEPAGPAAQHRHYGIFVAKGPGIKKDEIIYGASILDIAPTILTIFGLPIGEDMDGKPLINIFENMLKVKTIESWDNVSGFDGRHPSNLVIEPLDAKEALDQLVALGYIEETDQKSQKAVEESIKEIRFNLARSYMDAGLHALAVPILKDIYNKYPDEYRFGIHLANCYQATKRFEEAKIVIEGLLKRKRENSKIAAIKVKEFREARKDKPLEDWTREEVREFKKLRALAGINFASMEFLLGNLFMEMGEKEKALIHLKKAEKLNSREHRFFEKIGEIYLEMNMLDEAESIFKKALDIDSDSSEAYLGLGRVYLKKKRNLEAVEALLESIGLLFYNPKAHYYLGIGLLRIGKIVDAIQALKIAIAQNPNYTAAYKSLASIYRRRIKEKEKTEFYEQLAKDAEKRLKELKSEKDLNSLISKEDLMQTSFTSDMVTLLERHKKLANKPFDFGKTVFIVTGLPRSGTSMVMQMLEMGGIRILTDGVRAPDENNPKGYFEYEAVKQLRRNYRWLKNAKGKAVKIVIPLLQYLPCMDEIEYRVIFIERNIPDIISSQKSMLRRLRKRGGKLSDESLAKLYQHQINIAKVFLALREIPTLFINYEETLREPMKTALSINKFLGSVLNSDKLAAAVLPELKRHGR